MADAVPHHINGRVCNEETRNEAQGRRTNIMKRKTRNQARARSLSSLRPKEAPSPIHSLATFPRIYATEKKKKGGDV